MHTCCLIKGCETLIALTAFLLQRGKGRRAVNATCAVVTGGATQGRRKGGALAFWRLSAPASSDRWPLRGSCMLRLAKGKSCALNPVSDASLGRLGSCVPGGNSELVPRAVLLSETCCEASEAVRWRKGEARGAVLGLAALAETLTGEPAACCLHSNALVLPFSAPSDQRFQLDMSKQRMRSTGCN